MADGDHIVVEHARVDSVRMLLREKGPHRIEPVPPRDRSGRFERLPCRKAPRCGRGLAERDAAMNEEFDAASGAVEEAGVIGGAFVAELRRRRQRIVHHEMPRVGKNRAENPGGHGRLERSVEVADEIRRREVDTLIRGVGRRTHRRRIGDPHRGGGRARGQHARRIAPGGGDDLRVGAREAQRAQRGDGGPLVRWQHGLRHTRAPRVPASSPVPAAPPRAGWRRAAHAFPTRDCPRRDPNSCASGRECRRS